VSKKKLSIALTIRSDAKLSQIFYGNGLSQNVKFLYDLLKIIGHKPFFLVSNKQTDNTFKILNKGYKAYTFNEVLTSEVPVDIALECGVSIPEQSRKILRQKYNSIIVAVRYGHTMFMDMEQICHNETLSEGLYVSRPDIVWASPHFQNSFSYLETIYSAPVEVSPYLWEPDFTTQKPFTQDDYRETPDIFVMEPNISFLKNALIPMTILERQFRVNPDIFGKATILNGTGFNNRKYFLDNIVKNMPSLSSQYTKVAFTKRYGFDQVFRKRDVLIGHQHECPLNYLYLEALQRNVPLVHNSPDFADAGYYYPDFRVDIGQEKLAEAIQDKNLAQYTKNAKKVIKRYSIHNRDVQIGYRQLIEKTLALRK